MHKHKAIAKVRALRFVVLFAALLFIAIGLMKQEHLHVLQKAVRICLECIGIG